jgi:hypothetical protein
VSYLWAGYLLTWIVVAVYAWRLEGRRSDEERQLAFLREQRPRDEPGAAGEV